MSWQSVGFGGGFVHSIQFAEETSVIDTRPSFSLMTEMGLLAATDAIVPVKPRYLETVGALRAGGG